MTPLSHHQAQAIRRRRARDRQDDRDLADDRTASLVGLALVDAVWSNRSFEWFHVACADQAQQPVALANLEPATTRCAGCGAWLSDPADHEGAGPTTSLADDLASSLIRKD